MINRKIFGKSGPWTLSSLLFRRKLPEIIQLLSPSPCVRVIVYNTGFCAVRLYTAIRALSFVHCCAFLRHAEYARVKKMHPWGFLAIFSSGWEFLNWNFSTPIVCSYAWQSFIQLSLSLTELVHVKREHSVIFYISCEKCKKNHDISATVWLISTKFSTLMLNVTSNCSAV